ncbi:MAG: DUF4352 domain-containing protein [Anaerolineae bacterium]|nr:DUF4352 domain-containing protein [Anaerolineae bacterium]
MPPESQENAPIEAQAEESSLIDKIKENRSFLIGILVAMAFMGLCLFPIFLYLLFQGSGTDFLSGNEPTPFATDVSAALPVGTPLVQSISDTETISVTLDLPATLTLNGRSLIVQPQLIPGDGVWSPDVGEDSAAWVYGTIVNYVFGLPDTDENQTTLDLLGPGDEFEMVTQEGVPFVFSFESKEVVPATNRDIYTQQSPGATIILTGGPEEDRLVVKGRYVVSDTGSNFQANTCQVGETCQVGNMQIAVTGTAYDPSQVNVPAGFAYYRVDYQIENVGSAAIDTSQLQFSLTDEMGNQYALNPMASQSGNYPILSGPLNVGQIIQATTGYQVPASLESGTVHWVIADTATGAQIQVVIDYGGGDNAAQQTSITLIEASVSPDKTLLMDGQITNLGSQQVVVTQQDLSLRTDDGASFLLLATNPELPWTVPPGQTLQFYVQYQNPQAVTAVFTVLNQSFQLNVVR